MCTYVWAYVYGINELTDCQDSPVKPSIGGWLKLVTPYGYLLFRPGTMGVHILDGEGIGLD